MNLIALDTETTGIEPGSRLLEIAAIRFDADTGEPHEAFETLVNPGMPAPADALAINGIDPDHLPEAPRTAEALADLFGWIGGEPAVLVIHNAPYDLGVLLWEAGRTGVAMPKALHVVDTLAIARVLGDTKRNDLQTLAEFHGLSRDGQGHRAMPDADLARQIYRKVWPRIEGQPQALEEIAIDYAFTSALPGLECLPDLVAAGAPLSFRYLDAKGAATERTITPYGWAETPTGLMFHGLCKLRGERRTFRADRVQSIVGVNAAA